MKECVLVGLAMFHQGASKKLVKHINVGHNTLPSRFSISGLYRVLKYHRSYHAYKCSYREQQAIVQQLFFLGFLFLEKIFIIGVGSILLHQNYVLFCHFIVVLLPW